MPRKIIYILILCFLAALFSSGCNILQRLGLGNAINDELLPASSFVMEEEEAIKLKDKKPIKLFFADKEYLKLRAEIRYLNEGDMKGSAGSKATILVKELIKGSGKGLELENTIPEGTRLLEDVAVENRIATVNFSKEFVENHPGGKEKEKLTIYSVVNTLTELREIEEVMFKVEGESRDLYKGNFKFDKPFPRSTSIISKEPPLRSIIEQEDDRIEDKEDKDDGESSESRERDQKGQETEDEKADEVFENIDEEEILE